MKAPRTDGYHHGDLRQALLEAAEQLLKEKGVSGFTLRECARRAGVSPAAPAHHFGNVAGLLTAVATQGFRALAEDLGSAMGRAKSRGSRLERACLAYLEHARRWPDRYRLMFGSSVRLDDPDFMLANRKVFALVLGEIRGMTPNLTEQDLTKVTHLWAAMHGMVQLTIDGRLGFLQTDYPELKDFDPARAVIRQALLWWR